MFLLWSRIDVGNSPVSVAHSLVPCSPVSAGAEGLREREEEEEEAIADAPHTLMAGFDLPAVSALSMAFVPQMKEMNV